MGVFPLAESSRQQAALKGIISQEARTGKQFHKQESLFRR